MTDLQLNKLNGLIDNQKADNFYSWKTWMHVRAEVMRLDNNECQMCKAKGRYKKAEVVHHIKHLKDRPDLALSIWDGNERQLISVCKDCHDELHPEHMRQYKYKFEKPVTEESWE